MNTSKTSFEWGLIIFLSCLGLAHGVLSLFGLVRGWEYIIWILLGVLSIAVVVRRVDNKILIHGILIGLGITLFTGLPQSIFLDTYLNANPSYREGLDPDMNYSLFIVSFVPLFGGIYGLVIGLISLGLKRWIG